MSQVELNPEDATKFQMPLQTYIHWFEHKHSRDVDVSHIFKGADDGKMYRFSSIDVPRFHMIALSE